MTSFIHPAKAYPTAYCLSYVSLSQLTSTTLMLLLHYNTHPGTGCLWQSLLSADYSCFYSQPMPG